ncbi:hypothetical protein [Roseovarius sp. MMSF_3350]|uniref:hypothetical protein n=1 Tax=Roseovarius sp. MMSF_3350 TaxID=3046706 RepID=UPI00273EA207|nr:hypothetical protein [Roseovarius sp. MMSF_3350]
MPGFPELVSVETAQKYGSAMAKLNAAMEADDPEEVAKRAQVCMRGLAAMNQEAEAAGHNPEPGDVWEFDLDGFKFGIVQDIEDQARIRERRPDLKLFTMREAAMALRGYANSVLVEAAKHHSPHAEISKLPDIKLTPEFFEHGDPIPF